MRRSLGTKPPTIPIKRMRQSQEGAGAGQAPGTSRLSRSSAAGPGAMSSGKRVSSMSRSGHSHRILFNDHFYLFNH